VLKGDKTGEEMNTEKLERGNNLSKRIKEISKRLQSIESTGTRPGSDRCLSFEGANGYINSEAMSEPSLMAIKAIMVAEHESLLARLEKEFQEL
jgi:hypothetical protein